MLAIPAQGLNVLSSAPPSAETPDNPKNKQLLFITLNDQILAQILARHGKGLSVTFGSNAVRLPTLLYPSSFCSVALRLLRLAYFSRLSEFH